MFEVEEEETQSRSGRELDADATRMSISGAQGGGERGKTQYYERELKVGIIGTRMKTQVVPNPLGGSKEVYFEL